MHDELEPLEHDDLDPITSDGTEPPEELEPHDEGEPAAPDAAAAAAVTAGVVADLSGDEPPQADGAATATGSPGGDGVQSKRELEEAPLMLRKAATILFVGALFPWLSAMEPGPTPWGALLAGKAICLIAAWLYHQGTIAHYGGGNPPAFLAKLAALKKPAPQRKRGEKKEEESPVAAAQRVLGSHAIGLVTTLVAVVGFAATIGMWPQEVEGATVAGVDITGASAYLAGIGELATLLLATCTISSIYGYEHGGAFKPILPLMFLGPGIAGLLGTFRAFGNDPIGGIGNIVVGVGGLMAMYVMVIAMKQAKVEGDRKKEEARLARKAARDAAKAKSATSR